jgi:ABC-type glutathione transport system ATPase component
MLFDEPTSALDPEMIAEVLDVMVANSVYWRRDSGGSKRIFATIKSRIDAVKFSNTIQLSRHQLSI